jgi:hypothetical protein
MGKVAEGMTREERKVQQDIREDAERKKQEQINGIWKNYKKLSYRDKLLFMSVVYCLIDNPEEEV